VRGGGDAVLIFRRREPGHFYSPHRKRETGNSGGKREEGLILANQRKGRGKGVYHAYGGGKRKKKGGSPEELTGGEEGGSFFR